MKLKLYYRAKGTLHYTIGGWFRGIYLFFGSMLMLGAIASRNEPWFSWFSFPAAAAVFLLAAGCYEERWIFDRNLRQITLRYGLIFLFKRKIISFDDVDHFQLETFVKGKSSGSSLKRRFLKTYLKLTIARYSDNAEVVEIIPQKRSDGKTEQAARQIADYCGITLDSSDI